MNTNIGGSTSIRTAVPEESGLSVPGYLQINFMNDVRERKILARGGFGIVFLADALSPALCEYGPVVVVKQCRKEKMTDRDIQLLYQEISIMEYFKPEKHIAKIMGYSEEPFSIVMKYYNLGSLANWIDNTSDRLRIYVIAFMHDIGAGLMAMHYKGVVHNDLKPDNVLLDLDENGKPFCVLSDFGISQVLSDDMMTVKDFRLLQVRALSLAYSAPERLQYFRAKVLSVERETVFSWDVYSASVILFEMLTKKRAHSFD